MEDENDPGPSKTKEEYPTGKSKNKSGTRGPLIEEDKKHEEVVVIRETRGKKPKLKGTSTPPKHFTRSQAAKLTKNEVAKEGIPPRRIDKNNEKTQGLSKGKGKVETTEFIDREEWEAMSFQDPSM